MSLDRRTLIRLGLMTAPLTSFGLFSKEHHNSEVQDMLNFFKISKFDKIAIFGQLAGGARSFASLIQEEMSFNTNNATLFFDHEFADSSLVGNPSTKIKKIFYNKLKRFGEDKENKKALFTFRTPYYTKSLDFYISELQKKDFKIIFLTPADPLFSYQQYLYQAGEKTFTQVAKATPIIPSQITFLKSWQKTTIKDYEFAAKALQRKADYKIKWQHSDSLNMSKMDNHVLKDSMFTKIDKNLERLIKKILV